MTRREAGQAIRPAEGLFAAPRRVDALADLLANVWQFGYVTTDLDRAVEFMSERFGLEHCLKLPAGGATFLVGDEPGGVGREVRDGRPRWQDRRADRAGRRVRRVLHASTAAGRIVRGPAAPHRDVHRHRPGGVGPGRRAARRVRAQGRLHRADSRTACAPDTSTRPPSSGTGSRSASSSPRTSSSSARWLPTARRRELAWVGPQQSSFGPRWTSARRGEHERADAERVDDGRLSAVADHGRRALRAAHRRPQGRFQKARRVYPPDDDGGVRGPRAADRVRARRARDRRGRPGREPAVEPARAPRAVLRRAGDGGGDPHAQSAAASRRARVHRGRCRGPRDRRRRVAAAGIRRVPLGPRIRARDRRLAGRRRSGRRDRLRVADRRGRADGLARSARAPGRGHLLHVGHDRPAQGRPVLTPRARPALDGRGAARRDERLHARHRAAGRPDVPRERLGDPLHGEHGRGGAGAAGTAAGCRERARPAGRRARHAHRGRADGVDGDAEGDRGRARAVGSELAEPPPGGRLGRPQEHDRGLPAARPVHRPGLGDDRDVPARQHRDRAPGDGRRLRRRASSSTAPGRARRPRSSTFARAATTAS